MKLYKFIFAAFVLIQVEMKAQPFSPSLAADLQHTIDSFQSAYNLKGISASVFVPNEGIWKGVTGFYQLMQMMHFQPTSRTTKRGIYLDEIRGTLDCISFRHAMDGRTATLYNFCVYPKLED